METKIFGYVRVSSSDQNVDRQVDEMLAIGINERDIFIDKKSGKDFDRPEYIRLKNTLRTGDTVYIKSLDRFGRKKDKILKEWQELTQEMKVNIIVIDMPILDTTHYKGTIGLETLIADIVLQLLSYFAEEERDRIRARQREGIISAKNKGKQFGRPKTCYPTEWEKYYRRWKDGEVTAVKAFSKLGLSKSTFYKLVRIHENRE